MGKIAVKPHNLLIVVSSWPDTKFFTYYLSRYKASTFITALSRHHEKHWIWATISTTKILANFASLEEQT